MPSISLIEKQLKNSISCASTELEKMSCLFNLGQLYYEQDENSTRAMKIFNDAANIYEESKDKKLDDMAICIYQNIAMIHAYNGERSLALLNMNKCLHMIDDINDSVQLCYLSISRMYMQLFYHYPTTLIDIYDAKLYCAKSEEVLTFVWDLLNQKDIENGSREKRKADIDLMYSELYDILGEYSLADKYWTAAYEYAKSVKNIQFQCQLLRVRLDFEWIPQTQTVSELCHISPLSDQPDAQFRLAQSYIFDSPNNLSVARKALMECEKKFFKRMNREEQKNVQVALSLVIGLMSLKNNIETSNDRLTRRELYDKMADELLKFSRRPEIQKTVLKYYESVLSESETDKEKCEAKQSIAVTNMELKNYKIAADQFKELLALEIAMGADAEKTIETRVLIFNAHCRGSIKERDVLLEEMNSIIRDIPDNSMEQFRMLQADAYQDFAIYLLRQGDRKQATFYLNLYEDYVKLIDEKNPGLKTKCILFDDENKSVEDVPFSETWVKRTEKTHKIIGKKQVSDERKMEETCNESFDNEPRRKRMRIQEDRTEEQIVPMEERIELIEDGEPMVDISLSTDLIFVEETETENDEESDVLDDESTEIFQGFIATGHLNNVFCDIAHSMSKIMKKVIKTKKIAKIVKLDMTSFTELSDKSFPLMSEVLSNTEELSLVDCLLTTMHAAKLFKDHNSLPNMRCINLSQNVDLSTDGVCNILTKCPNIEQLYLSNINVTQNVNNLLDIIGGLEYLEVLDISHNKWLNGNVVEKLLSYPYLRLRCLRMVSIDMRNVNIKTSWLPVLRRFDLSQCTFSNLDSLLTFQACHTDTMQLLDLSHMFIKGVNT